MTGLASVLRGVQPDLRDTIKRLHEEGWTPSRTNGGHIRLDHAQAAKPVFTSTTPSDFRTPFNLLRDCRSALMGTARCPDPSRPLIGPDQAAEILSAHKRKRRGSARAGVTALPGLVAARIRAEAAKKEEGAGDRPVETGSPDLPPLTGPVLSPEHPYGAWSEARNPPRPAETTEQQKELTEMNMISRLETETANPVMEGPASAGPAVSRTRPVRAGAPRTPGTQTRTAPLSAGGQSPLQRPAGKAPVVPGPAPSQVVQTLPLDQEAVRIGMMIALGELTALEITPEMVGQTLVFAQAPYLIGASVLASAPEAPRVIRRNVAFNDVILDFLRTFPGEDVPVSMIAEHMISRGHYKPKSARFGVRTRLEQLLEAGLITLTKGPGEPHARLVG